MSRRFHFADLSTDDLLVLVRKYEARDRALPVDLVATLTSRGMIV